MKAFGSFTMVRQPLDEVWVAVRDRLPEIAGRLEDLESVVTLERVEEADGRLRLLNRWTARRRIPAPLRGIAGADAISWLDRAEWVRASRTCLWSITPSVLRDHIQCSGSTRYEPAMACRGTRVTFEGTFALRSGFLAGMPAAFEPTIQALVESIFTTMVPGNLAKAVNAAAEIIAAERAGGQR